MGADEGTRVVAQDSFEEFVASRGADLRRLAFLLTSDRQNAEELVASTLVRCLAGWRRIEQEEDPFDFARGVLLEQRLPRHRRSLSSLIAALPHRGVDADTDAAPDADDLDNDDVRDEVLRGLPGLRGTERKVVVLRLLEGLSDGETAAALRCAPATVRRHYGAAVERVREAAAGAGSGPPDRAARAKQRLRARHRYQAAAVAVLLALGAVAGVGFTRQPRSSAPLADGATPGARSAPTVSAPAPLSSLTSRTTLPSARAGANIVRMRAVGGHRQLWLYDATTLAPVRALLPPDDARTTTGVTAVDPDGDTRVIFVRRITVDVAATDGHEQPLVAWRLDELSLRTRQVGVLTRPQLGDGPDHLFFSPQGHRLAVVTDTHVQLLNTFDDGVAPIDLDVPPRATVIGFLAADGPLLVSELESPAPASIAPIRQTVVAIDPEHRLADSVVYDSLAANCNPTQQIWAPPTGALIVRTRCGSGRTDPSNEDGLGFHVVDAEGAHQIAASTSPVNYSQVVSWDSTGAALIVDYTPICNGGHVFERVTMTGARKQLRGSFAEQICY